MSDKKESKEDTIKRNFLMAEIGNISDYERECIMRQYQGKITPILGSNRELK